MIGAKKIAVIGGSGTGKTTLTTNLKEDLNLPVIHIDGIQHFENWKKRDNEERDKIILEKMNADSWIMDGTYTSTLKERIKQAELVIYLDYSRISQVTGVLKRYLKNPGKEKPEIPGCNEQMTWSFLKWVWNWRKNKRKIVLDAINEVKPSEILIFKSRRQLNKWYYNTFKHKMKIEF